MIEKNVFFDGEKVFFIENKVFYWDPPRPHEQYAEMLANFEDWAAMKAPSIPASLKKPPMMELYGRRTPGC